MMKAERPEALTCAVLRCGADDVSHMLGGARRAKEVVTPVLSFGSTETTFWFSSKQCSSTFTLAETLVNSTASSD